ncbi:DegV family protein [Spiroplasma endosymbiont of Zeiraphera isertana]|uniref:DegV family protein n=1 Tax=Spiroplasma endosymbiont of Zeiraphera isertana TaxID=3066313 RepID=UPI00313B379E
MKIGIVSDSATGFTVEDMKKYPEIIIIPLNIIEGENAYDDNNVDIDSETIRKKMIDEHCILKTSQTSRGKLEQYWDNALSKYDQILFLPIANNASGQYASSQVLQKEEKYKNKVHILETGAASIPLKFMVLIAFTLVKNGKKIPEILGILNKFRKTYESYIAPNDLKFLARGGRLPMSKARIGNFLRFKPILRCKETIDNIGRVRTLSKAMEEMLDIITKIKDVTKETIYIIDGWCRKDIIDEAIKKVKNRGFTKYKVEPLCNILKTHTGNNTIGFSVVPNQWVKEV